MPGDMTCLLDTGLPVTELDIGGETEDGLGEGRRPEGYFGCADIGDGDKALTGGANRFGPCNEPRPQDRKPELLAVNVGRRGIGSVTKWCGGGV